VVEEAADVIQAIIFLGIFGYIIYTLSDVFPEVSFPLPDAGWGLVLAGIVGLLVFISSVFS